MKATTFHDMSSGGYKKLDHRIIIIEAPENEAISVFYSRFKRNPHRVTCTCCGADYSVTEYESIEQAIDLHTWDDKVLVIRAVEIMPHERTVHVPQEGYVWMGDE